MKDLIKPYSKTPNLKTLRYPVIATPKLDGIRCAVENGKLRTFNKKPVPNKHINEAFEPITHLMEGFDGELMIPGQDFNGVQSAVMSRTGKPAFKFMAFDLHNSPLTYVNRTNDLYAAILVINNLGYAEASFIEQVPQTVCRNADELQAFWDKCIADGYEGAIVADPHGYYKNGRSGLKEQLLLKLKLWHDDEAIVIEVQEEIAQDGTPKGRAGALLVKHSSGCEFGVAGFDDIAKASMWINRKAIVGKTITFKYQDWPAGGNPRFPGFKGFRHD